MFTNKIKKTALALAFTLAYSSSANARVGNFYAGLGADLGYTVHNSAYDDQQPMAGIVSDAYGNKVTGGFEVRFGYEVFLLQRLYMAGEAFAKVMFDISGTNPQLWGGGFRNADNPYISGGLTYKLGVGFNEQKTKLYLLATSEYMSAAIGPNTPDQIGLALVGGGLGVKQQVTRFMDIFLEAKILFDVFSHIDFRFVRVASVTDTYSQTGSVGYQLLNVAIGADFKF